jgi:hypothetical protein
MDETGLPMISSIEKTVAQRGKRLQGSCRNNKCGMWAVIGYCSAIGVYIPPIFIFKMV